MQAARSDRLGNRAIAYSQPTQLSPRHDPVLSFGKRSDAAVFSGGSFGPYGVISPTGTEFAPSFGKIGA